MNMLIDSQRIQIDLGTQMRVTINIEPIPDTTKDAQPPATRRTNKDKRKAVIQALLHPMGTAMSDHNIAKHVGVCHTTVSNIRKELESTARIGQSTLRAGQDGRTIDTARIGSGRQRPFQETMYVSSKGGANVNAD